jgi:hypothetical protein
LPTRAILRPFVTIALLLALAAAAVLGCAGKGARDPFAMVGIDEVQRMMSEPGVAIIDANTRETFEKHHLPGAKHYKAAPFAEVLPPDKGTKLVFYCASPT